MRTTPRPKNNNLRVQKAVFPVAGLGTRFLPATKASPKEMLAVVDKPLIQYAVEEAYAAGIREMIFVTGRNKRAIEDHFDTAYELEAELASGGKDELMALVHSIKPDDMDCVYVRQPRALGLGHAVLCAERLVRGEPFAVLLADDLMIGDPPIMQQMIELFAAAPVQYPRRAGGAEKPDAALRDRQGAATGGRSGRNQRPGRKAAAERRPFQSGGSRALRPDPGDL
jgi:dTDP-glucose pyrophosphorylase